MFLLCLTINLQHQPSSEHLAAQREREALIASMVEDMEFNRDVAVEDGDEAAQDDLSELEYDGSTILADSEYSAEDVGSWKHQEEEVARLQAENALLRARSSLMGVLDQNNRGVGIVGSNSGYSEPDDNSVFTNVIYTQRKLRNWIW